MSCTPNASIWHMAKRDTPMPMLFHRVPTTENHSNCITKTTAGQCQDKTLIKGWERMHEKRTVPMFSKKGLVGIKYPESRTMGGSMYRKKTLLVRTAGGSSWTECMMAPTMRPTLMRRQDSGTQIVILWYTWKPGGKNVLQSS